MYLRCPLFKTGKIILSEHPGGTVDSIIIKLLSSITFAMLLAAFSLEPEEFKAMVKSIKEVKKALGEVSYDLTEKMKKSRELSRSLFYV
ncbi:hypothetical protein ES708_32560 [subsurface metagenome]